MSFLTFILHIHYWPRTRCLTGYFNLVKYSGSERVKNETLMKT